MTNDNTTPGEAANPPANPTPSSNVGTQSAAADSQAAGTDASASAGTETPTKSAEQLAVAAHPHHNLVHGAVVAAEALIRQLEAHVSEECHEAIEHFHSAVAKLKNKLEFVYKQPE